MSLGINLQVYSDFAEKLHFIEEELRAQPITREIREQIIHELDEVHKGISQLETTAVRVNQFAQSFLEQLRQQAIFLYGEVDDFFYKHEIEVIQDETQLLEHTLECKDRARITMLTDSLKAHINQLLETYSPLLKERRTLVFAKLMLEQAEALLNGQRLQRMAIDEWSFLEAEEILEELVDYLGQNDRKGLRFMWSRLTAVQRKIVMAYLHPKDVIDLLHDVEGATNDNPFMVG